MSVNNVNGRTLGTNERVGDVFQWPATAKATWQALKSTKPATDHRLAKSQSQQCRLAGRSGGDVGRGVGSVGAGGATLAGLHPSTATASPSSTGWRKPIPATCAGSRICRHPTTGSATCGDAKRSPARSRPFARPRHQRQAAKSIPAMPTGRAICRSHAGG